MIRRLSETDRAAVLEAYGRVSAHELAEVFDVSERTIRRIVPAERRPGSGHRRRADIEDAAVAELRRQELSWREIGEVLGVPASTVASRWHRGQGGTAR